MGSNMTIYKDYAELSWAAYGDLKRNMSSSEYRNELHNMVFLMPGTDFTEKQADIFASRYEIIASTDDYFDSGSLSGMSAVIFYDEDTKRHILSIRGTEPYDVRDLIADAQLSTGYTVVQVNALKEFYLRVVAEGFISSTTKLDVTGHSLGGFLSQVFATSEYINIVEHVYTFNSPGINGIPHEIVRKSVVSD